jgi:hypothetical protein
VGEFLEPRHAGGDFVAVEQHGRSVVIKPKKLVDPDDVLTPEEGAHLKKAEHEMLFEPGQELELN